MGLPIDALATAANSQLGVEFFEAPLSLQTESYESFAQQFRSALGQDGQSRASVAEELRNLQIDPEVFYGNAKRLGVSEHSSESLDPTIGPSSRQTPAPMAPPTPATLAALLAGDAIGGAVDEGPAAGEVDQRLDFEPPARGVQSGSADLLEAQWYLDREKEIESYHIETNADAACRLGMCGLNVPDSEAIEEPACEEIMLDAEEEPTRGGRLSCETPRGLEAKLQIDSLTDDEDDEFLQPAPADGETRAADEEDEIEAFSLDPDFDYDKVDNLTRRC